MSKKLPSTLAWISATDIKAEIALGGYAKKIDLVGALVMGERSVEFLEMVICPRESFKDWLRKYPAHEISEDKHELVVSVRGKQVILYIASDDTYGAVQVYLSSLPDYMLGLVKRAGALGYSFGKAGLLLSATDEPVPTPTEAEFFNVMKIEAIPATERRHSSQVTDSKSAPVQIDGDTYEMPASSGDSTYKVILGEGQHSCTCPDYTYRGGEENPSHECKHIKQAKTQRSQ